MWRQIQKLQEEAVDNKRELHEMRAIYRKTLRLLRRKQTDE